MNHDIDSILPKYIMVKNNPLNRMPKKGKPLPGNNSGGKDSDDESDSSVDSHGNLRDLIDYGSDSEEPSPRPIRKAALLARKKIDLIMKKSRKEDKESRPQNTIHYPTVKRRPHLPLSPSIYSPKSSTEEDIEETEDEIDIEETDEETEMEEAEMEETESNEDENEELFRYLLKMGDRGNDTMVPKKYNMKLEPESVQRFVTLLTTPMEKNTIDTQIGQFKEMTEEQQNELLYALEHRPAVNNSGINLMLRILTMKLPQEIQATILAKYNSLQSLEQSSNEYFKLRAWLDKVISIPFGTYKDIPVRLDDGPEKCGDFMRNSKKCMDESVYGQEDSKLQIMQFISSKIANPNSRGLCLLLTGPPGVGKTSLIKNGIAKALGWPFQFISLSGDSDATSANNSAGGTGGGITLTATGVTPTITLQRNLTALGGTGLGTGDAYGGGGGSIQLNGNVVLSSGNSSTSTINPILSN